MNAIKSLGFNPKPKSKATQLLEMMISELPLPVQIMVRAHPFARQVANIPNEEIDKMAPRMMRLLHDWYGEPTHQPDN